MSSITYLQLDPSDDPIFDPKASLTDLAAVTQAIETRLLLFAGEWWEDLNEGTPMFQSILGASANPKNLQAMNLILSQRIQSTPFVSSVLSASVTFDPVKRAFTFSATAQTAFGPTTVIVTLPGSSASLGN